MKTINNTFILASMIILFACGGGRDSDNFSDTNDRSENEHNSETPVPGASPPVVEDNSLAIQAENDLRSSNDASLQIMYSDISNDLEANLREAQLLSLGAQIAVVSDTHIEHITGHMERLEGFIFNTYAQGDLHRDSVDIVLIEVENELRQLAENATPTRYSDWEDYISNEINKEIDLQFNLLRANLTASGIL